MQEGQPQTRSPRPSGSAPGDQDHPAAAHPTRRSTELAHGFSPLTQMMLHRAPKERYVCVDEGSTLGLSGCTKDGVVTGMALARAAGARQLPFHGIGSYTKTFPA